MSARESRLYEQHLLPYMFTYELENHEPVKLHFEKDNFCHGQNTATKLEIISRD